MTIKPHETECMADMLRQATEIEEWTTVERVTEMLRAMTTTQQQPAAEGEWVLFPREPTVEILLALSHALGIEPLGEDANEGYPITGQQSTVRQYYVALIAAAPAKVAVSDAMVERALTAVWIAPFGQETKDLMRASLEAALRGGTT